MKDAPKTPCIGVCSTGIGDEVCRGCKRFSHEVIAWNSFSQEQQRSSLQRLDTLLQQVCEPKIYIADASSLYSAMKDQQLLFDESRSPYAWLQNLLKAGASQIISMEPYGCHVQRTFQHLSLMELKDIIDRDFYTLSCVHYERYFSLA